MDMRRWKGVFMIGVLAAVLCAGCGTRDMSKMITDHKGSKMYDEGVWEKRYENWETKEEIGEERYTISVEVKKDMSEDDMLEVLDYEKLCYHSEMDDTGAYLGDRDTTWICYAVFYRGDTDEELKRIKYVDGESVEITEEDREQFAGPELRNIDFDMEESEDMEE